MKFEDMEAVRRHLKLGVPLPCYMIEGSEDNRKLQVMRKICEITVGGSDFDAHRFSGNVSADTLADAAFEITFGGGRRCVVAEDIPFGSQFVSENEFKKFEQLITEVCEMQGGAVLVFLFTAVDTAGKKDYKKQGEKKENRFEKLRKLIEKSGGAVIKCEPASQTELCNLLENTAKKLGCMLERKLSLYMVERCGNDSSNLLNELRKTAEFCKTGTITKDDIDTMTCPTPDAKIYDIASRITASDSAGAFAAVDELRELGTEPTAALASLSGIYVDMFRAGAARNSGKTKADIAKDWQRSYAGRDFLIDRAMTARSRISSEKLLKSLEILAEADEQMKSTGADGWLIVEKAVAELFAAKR